MTDRNQCGIDPYERAEPLDVHRWSEQPKVYILLDRMTTDRPPDFKARTGRARDFNKLDTSVAEDIATRPVRPVAKRPAALDRHSADTAIIQKKPVPTSACDAEDHRRLC